MAQKLTSESANREHNIGARKDAIKKLDRDLRPLEAEKVKLNEDIQELRQTFKADTNITLADFDAARRVALIEDDDERRGKIDNFRECYNVLKPGEQLSWLDSMESEAKPSGNGATEPAGTPA